MLWGTADYFGGRNMGGILGVLYTAAGAGALIGPVVAGAVYDARDSYTLPILLAVVMNGVAMVCIALMPEPARWNKPGAELPLPLPAPATNEPGEGSGVRA